MSRAQRQHPRFVDERKVLVDVPDRASLVELWISDISKGGMFIRCAEPPPMRTLVAIHLDLPTGQTLKMDAEVVHVQAGVGIGVQFVGLSHGVRASLERYVDGVAQRLTLDMTSDLEETPVDQLLEEARRVMEALKKGDLYEVVQLPPNAASSELVARVDKMVQRFEAAPKDASPPQLARIRQVVRQLVRLKPLFDIPGRRANYDLRHGHLRVAERRAANEDFKLLRRVYKDLFPDRIALARARARQAKQQTEQGETEHARRLIEQVLRLDPFNRKFFELYRQWEANHLEKDDTCSVHDAAHVKYEMGQRHFNEGSFSIARSFFSAAVQLVPLPDYRAALATSMLCDPHFDRDRALAEAKPLLEAAIEATTDDLGGAEQKAKYHYQLGRLLREHAQTEDARRHLSAAADLDPKLEEARSELRLLELRAKKRSPFGWVQKLVRTPA